MTAATNEPKIIYDEFGFVKARFCPYCGEEYTTPPRVDDAGTSWWRCSKGHESCKPKSEVRKNFEAQAETDRAVEAEAQRLRGLNLLKLVVQHGRRKLIGEDNVLLMNFLIICSGQTRYPISGIVTGFSGSGKNESIRALLPLIPQDCVFEFTLSTPEAIKYIPEDFAGTLLMYEIEGLGDGKTGSMGLKAVGEGKSISTIYPTRDEETGKMVLGTAKTNAKNFLTTTNGVFINPDLYRRTLRFSMNDSTALTKRVIAKKLRDSMLPESLKALQINKEQSTPFAAEAFQIVITTIDWEREVVVFPPTSLMRLIDLVFKREQEVAVRTHVEHVLSFIKILALLRQNNRVRFTVGDNRYVIANDEDYNTALEILQNVIIETITRVDKRQREALEVLENCDHTDKNQLAEKLGVATRTAAGILKRLYSAGYLKETQTTRPYQYERVEEKPKSSALFKNAREYALYYLTELRKLSDGTSCLAIKGCDSNIIQIENPELVKSILERTNSNLLSVARQEDLSKQEPCPFDKTKLNPFANFERANENADVSVNQADNTTPRKIILPPRDMCSLREEVKSPFSKKQFTDCLKKFGFESSDADRKFDDMLEQGYFYAIDIDKTQFNWTYN